MLLDGQEVSLIQIERGAPEAQALPSTFPLTTSVISCFPSFTSVAN